MNDPLYGALLYLLVFTSPIVIYSLYLVHELKKMEREDLERRAGEP